MADKDLEDLVRRDIAVGLAGQSDEQNENPARTIFAPLKEFNRKRGEFPGITARTIDGRRGRTAVEWSYRGQHVGTLAGIRPTDRVVTVRGVTIVEQRDGKPPLFRRYVDWSEVMGALGVTATFRPTFDSLEQIPGFGEPAHSSDDEHPG